MMNRRDLLQISATAGLVALAGNALAVEAGHDQHSGHAGHEDHEGHDHGGGAGAALAAKAAACAAAGEACLTHCLATLAKGDVALAECARTVRDVIATCDALRELAAANSPHLKALAQVAAAACRDCAAECHKHTQHPTCRDCEQACNDCAKGCEAA